MQNYIFLMLVSVFATSLTAQKWAYGAKGGLCLSKVTEIVDITKVFVYSEEVATYRHLPVWQFHAGIWGQYYLDDRQSLQAEVLWSQQAYRDRDDFLSADEDAYVQFNYLSLPFLLRYHFTPRTSMALGPQFSLLLAHSPRNTNNIQVKLSSEEIAWELGAVLELGYELDRWRLGLRAQRDLTHFFSANLFRIDGTYFGTERYYHQALQLWVGYNLGR